MSLYRKYRPQTFADVVGQEHIVTTLENATSQGTLVHAYLFAGSRGTGKTSIARILAKHMLTKGIDDETLRRHIEQGVTEGTIVDLIEIDGASNRRIEDSRDLVEKIQFSPVVTKAKVYIIDEVHMLTKEAFNALLKTLEEPPPYAYFILATTELQKIPATIQSRCQRFAFRHIREEDIIRRLQYIADQEKITIDRAALRAIAHHAQGGMRDAISLLDQLRSLEKITLDDVRQRMGETGLEELEAIFAALDERNATEILSIVGRLEDAGIPADVFLRSLLGEARKRLHTAVEEGSSPAPMTALLETLLKAIRDVRVSPVPGLVLEAALLGYCGGASEEAPKRESKLFKRQKQEQPEAPRAEAPAQKKEPLPEQEEKKREKDPAPAIVEAPALSVQSVVEVWPDLLQRASPPALKMSLKNGRIAAVNDKTVTIAFTAKFHRDRVAQKDAVRTIEQLLAEHFKRPLLVDCIVEEEKNVTPIADKNLVNLADAVSEIF